MVKIQWKRSYGDGEETSDYVLWANGKPTAWVISQAGCWRLMYGKDELYLADTLKECKEFFEQNYSYLYRGL